MPFPFSDRSIGYLAEAISVGCSHASMNLLMMKAGASNWSREEGNKLDRALATFRLLREDDSPRAAEAALEARGYVHRGAPAGLPRRISLALRLPRSASDHVRCHQTCTRQNLRRAVARPSSRERSRLPGEPGPSTV